ncbi:MAG: hypothetical protein JXQ73_07080 [Phycisphaerae bacterium]|nr:hypothetical protein [Phycisphaerae bacterium]
MIVLPAVVLSVASSFAGAAGEVASRPGRVGVEVTCVDAEATGYGTFQSHNQKVLSNSRGIFMTHIRSRNADYTAQEWRLSRSVDGGRTFATVYQATNATNPPVIETDEGNNVYLVRPDFVDGHAYLYRFLAKDDYARPVVSRIPQGSAGKFCMVYDGPRKQLYYFAHNNTFHIIGLDGTVRHSCDLLRGGEHAVLQYPLLSLGPDGVLYAGWTTQKHGVYLYWDIHCMRSADGGRSWTRLAGEPVALPAVADEGGPAERITLDDEFESHTWLSNMLHTGGKVHFLYLAQTKPTAREHYVRYDAKTGKEDLRIQPEFRGETISLQGLSGFFAADHSKGVGRVYCVSRSDGRIGCLVSGDNGRTWRDHAVTEKAYQSYSIGGCRELTADGYVIGTFTDQVASTADVAGKCPVYFFRIRGR